MADKWLTTGCRGPATRWGDPGHRGEESSGTTHTHYRCRVSEETEPQQPVEHVGPTFAELGLGDAVLKALKDVGYENPSTIQAETIPPLLAGRDLVGLAQTGTGKTAAFALPWRLCIVRK